MFFYFSPNQLFLTATYFSVFPKNTYPFRFYAIIQDDNVALLAFPIVHL